MQVQSVAVIGAGAWGTALAVVAARAGRDVVLCGRNPASLTLIAARRENPLLPGISLDDAIAVTDDLALAARADIVLLAVPAQAMRDAASALAVHLDAGKPLVVCAKGIEHGSNLFMTDVVRASAPHARTAILSGPSFAADVARGLPTAVTLAAADETLGRGCAQALGSPTFRPYHTTDVRGVEIGGAVKNVLAIAAGIVAGRDLGASAQAALITRGFREIVRFGKACGAREETLTGLSGFGDVMLSCASMQSRNFALGVALGRDEPPSGKLAEGAFTAPVLATLAGEKSVEMPVASAVAAILGGGTTIDRAIDDLLARPLREETA